MSTIWPAGCTVVFEQQFDPRGEHKGQVIQTILEARNFEMGYGRTMEIKDEAKNIVATVNFDKVLIILPILTVGPGAA